MIDYELYMEMLQCESTSGKERALAELLMQRMQRPDNTIEALEVGDGTLNLLIRWGEPTWLYCTHLDTVPPYIPPTRRGDTFYGRGTCDAKGQIAAMWAACCARADRGETGFGLLLLSGEETGSHGAKAFAQSGHTYDRVIVGEPTDNRWVSASKGTKSFRLTCHGKACHSGYPEQGHSAAADLVALLHELSTIALPTDETLGETTYNIGELHADNRQNILAPEASVRIYWRTTFATDERVGELMAELAARYGATLEAFGGDRPSRYAISDAHSATCVVAFGSDAPQLSNCREKMLYGAGSILVAHTEREQVSVEELERAAEALAHV